MKTELKNRTLWFDGVNQVNPSFVSDLLLHGVPPSKIVVTEKDDDVEKFNSLSEIQIHDSKSTISELDLSWKIPKKYLELDLDSFVLSKAVVLGKEYEERAKIELAEVKKRNLEPLFKTLVYIVDRFKSEKIIYGVGRGSSCASLVLFLIGLHLVDPVKYEIPHTEFFHD